MNNLTILVVGGHPADVFDHCGGTLAHHIGNGDHVTTLALTQGLRIHDEVISEVFRFGTKGYTQEQIDRICREREQVKYKEVIDACALFGITDVRFLSYDDKMLQVTMEMINAVAKTIRDVRPDIVITHYPLENGGIGSHHGNTGKIVMDAIELAGTVDFEDKNPGHRTPQVFFMSPIEATIRSNILSAECLAYCNYYVDITDVAELKVKAMDIMRSQQYQGPYARRHTEVWSGKDGHFMDTGYCESFVTYHPEVGHLLSVSDYLRMKSNEPEKDKRARCSQMIAEFME